MKSIVIACVWLAFWGIDVNKKAPKNDVCLSAEEKKLYELMMEYRKNSGLPPIPISYKLTLVAQTHAHDLADNYTFDFKNKCNPHSWSKKGKWSACCYSNDHKQAKCMWDKPKEIAGYAGSGYEIAYFSSKGATAQEGLDGWRVSPAHNPLIINEGMWSKVQWKGIGIGIYKEYGIVWFGEVEDSEELKDCIP
ncbi:MAG: CAP domain-containing protein [Bacteroidota bacterium]